MVIIIIFLLLYEVSKRKFEGINLALHGLGVHFYYTSPGTNLITPGHKASVTFGLLVYFPELSLGRTHKNENGI